VYLNRSLYYVYYVSLDAAYADFSQMTGRPPKHMESDLPHSVDCYPVQPDTFGIDIDILFYVLFATYTNS